MDERALQKYKIQIFEWGKCFDKMLETLKSLIYLSEFENFELDEKEKHLLTSCIESKTSDYRNMFSLILQEQTKQLSHNTDLAKVCNEYIISLRKDVKTFLESVDEAIDHLVVTSFTGQFFKAKTKSDISRYKLEFGLCSLDDSKKTHEELYSLLYKHSDKIGLLTLGSIQDFASILVEKFKDKKRAVDILNLTVKSHESRIKGCESTHKYDKAETSLQSIKDCIDKWK